MPELNPQLKAGGLFQCLWPIRRHHLLKKRPWHRCFPVNFAKFLRTPFFTENLWWLLLDILHDLRMIILVLQPVCIILLKMSLLKAFVRYFLTNLYFSPNDSPSKTMKAVFLFHLKSSFCSQDIQLFIFLSFPLFLPVSHCFRSWSNINLTTVSE